MVPNRTKHLKHWLISNIDFFSKRTNLGIEKEWDNILTWFWCFHQKNKWLAKWQNILWKIQWRQNRKICRKKWIKLQASATLLIFFLHVFLFCLHWIFYKIFCLLANHLFFWWKHQNQVRILSHSFSITKFVRLLKKSIGLQLYLKRDSGSGVFL